MKVSGYNKYTLRLITTTWIKEGTHPYINSLQIDWATGDLDLRIHHASDTSVTFPIMFGHAQRYAIHPKDKVVSLRKFLTEEILPLVEKVTLDYSTVWDGQNNVGQFTSSAYQTKLEITKLFDDRYQNIEFLNTKGF